MSTPAENRAALDRQKAPQTHPFRVWNGYHFGKLPDTQKTIPTHARTIR